MNHRRSILVAALAAFGVQWIGIEPASADPARVYFLAGQSNMQGTGVSSGLTPPLSAPQPDVNYWDVSGWTPLAPGFGVTAAQFGPEVSFGRAIKDAHPDCEVYLIKHAVSGTNLHTQWAPGTGGQYSAFVAAANAALAALDGASVDYRIAGMAWMQGESDALDGQGAAYEANLNGLIAAVRTEFSAPGIPVAIGRIVDTWGTAEQNALVRAAQQAVGESDPHAVWIDTDGFGVSGGHYTTSGNVDLGNAFAAGLESVSAPAPAALPTGAALMMLIAARRRG